MTEVVTRLALFTLLPVLGFVDMYYLTFARVADHWQYFALIGILVPVAAIVARWQERIQPAARHAISATAILVLGILTWKQASAYADSTPSPCR